ncbi:MAG: hypothetical protein ACRYG7_14110 [Janthinobacterium lividum]
MATSLTVTEAASLAYLLNATDPGLRAKALIKCWGSLTPAIARQSAQVSTLKAQAKGDVAEALGNLLTFAAMQFNVGKNLNDVQIALLASEMLRLYWHWRFDEFSLMLREAVAGRYGTTYDRLDAATVHEWCAKYEASRNEVEAAASEQQAREYKLAESRPPTSELATHPDYADVCKQLEALASGNLVATARYYRLQPGDDNQFIADVADEEICRRNLSQVLAPLRERLESQAKPMPTLREQMANQMQATRERISAKLLGENSPVWGIAQHWLDIIDVESEPVAPEMPKDQAA